MWNCPTRTANQMSRAPHPARVPFMVRANRKTCMLLQIQASEYLGISSTGSMHASQALPESHRRLPYIGPGYKPEHPLSLLP